MYKFVQLMLEWGKWVDNRKTIALSLRVCEYVSTTTPVACVGLELAGAMQDPASAVRRIIPDFIYLHNLPYLTLHLSRVVEVLTNRHYQQLQTIITIAIPST